MSVERELLRRLWEASDIDAIDTPEWRDAVVDAGEFLAAAPASPVPGECSREADGDRLYAALALFDRRDGTPLASIVHAAREGWERSHPDMAESTAWDEFDARIASYERPASPVPAGTCDMCGRPASHHLDGDGGLACCGCFASMADGSPVPADGDERQIALYRNRGLSVWQSGVGYLDAEEIAALADELRKAANEKAARLSSTTKETCDGH